MPYDPVCGKKVNKEIEFAYEGKKYYFCSEECMKEFIKNPGKYVINKQEGNFC